MINDGERETEDVCNSIPAFVYCIRFIPHGRVYQNENHVYCQVKVKRLTRGMKKLFWYIGENTKPKLVTQNIKTN